jgi:hypothetical protein
MARFVNVHWLFRPTQAQVHLILHTKPYRIESILRSEQGLDPGKTRMPDE